MLQLNLMFHYLRDDKVYMKCLRVTLLATALMLATFGGIAVSPVGPVNAVDATSVASVAGITAAARPSTPQGKPDQVGGKTLTFLSFNMCKSECAAPAPEWSVRRDRIARVISESGASVVGVQEATSNDVATAINPDYVPILGGAPVQYKSIEQWEDIERRIAPAGYKSPEIDKKNNVCISWGGKNPPVSVQCTSSPRIYYKDSVVTQMVNAAGQPAAGFTSLGLIAPGVSSESTYRAVAWAYFDSPGTGPFLAVSLHMTNEKEQFAEDDRNAIARALAPWADSLNARMGINSATTVLMADLNSFKDRQPRGAQFILSKNGWKDAWNAKKRINIQYSTINVTPDTRKFGGWPLKPHMRWDKGVGTRIDYIFAKGPVTFTEYEVMLWTNRDGTFNIDYQASDHQAIRAVVKFN